MKQEITKKQAIKDLRKIFKINDKKWVNRYETKGRFGINKKVMEREQVISKLFDYFEDKMFVKGWELSVGQITFIYTTFEIRASWIH